MTATSMSDASLLIPLNAQQRAMWFMHRMDSAGSAYAVGLAVHLVGPVDVDALEAAVVATTVRHRELRCQFVELDGRPWKVATRPAGQVERADLPADACHDDHLVERLDQLANDPFDLSRSAPFRAELVRCGPDHVSLLLGIHHIVFDGWSTQVFMDDVRSAYLCVAAGREPGLDGLDDVADRILGGAPPPWTGADESFWRRMVGRTPRLELPLDRPRPAVQSFAGASLRRSIDPATTAAVRELARHCSVTPFSVLLAAFAWTMRNITGQDDVLIGIPTAGRAEAESQGMVGLFANTLPARLRSEPEGSFADAVRRAGETVQEVVTRQGTPFLEVVSVLSPPRQPNRSPFFDVTMQYLPAFIPRTWVEGVRAETWGAHRRGAQFDLSIDVHDEGDQFVFLAEYATDLFDECTVQGWLAQMAADLARLVVRPADDTHQPGPTESGMPRRGDGGGPSAPTGSPAGDELVELLSRPLREHPARIAVRDESTVFDYGHLERITAHTACALREAGVRPGDVVACVTGSSVATPAAVLAVLRCGAVYFPLDIAWPAARLAAVFRAASPSALLWSGDLPASLPAIDVSIPRLHLDLEAVGAADEPWAPAPPGAAAYLLFTSGSTGTPKGVVTTREGVASLCRSLIVRYKMRADDIALQFHSPAVDVSIEEMLVTLAVHASLLVTGPHVPDLAERIDRGGVTVANLPSSVWHTLCDEDADLPGLRLMIVGSEPVDPQRVRRWHAAGHEGTRLVNAYGLTEATVTSTTTDVDEVLDGVVPIGHPIEGVRTRLVSLDDGSAELALAGPGVAWGYLGDPRRTAQRFVPDPDGPPSARSFLTGDRVRSGTSGLVHEGRIDNQVKVRGHRVELGEVDAVALDTDGVSDAVTVVREDLGTGFGRDLVTYVVADPERRETHRLKRVDDWALVHDSEEANQVSACADPRLNHSGWISPYDGLAIPEPAMREWRDETVARIAARSPRRLLEIGCGTGMLLFPLLESLSAYIGTDISPAALDHVRAELRPEEAERVRLIQTAAHDLRALDGESFDCIVLNSVVQYFPDAGYLTSVLDACRDFLRPGGTIFVGDVRDQDRLRDHHLRVLQGRHPRLETGELHRRAEAACVNESELCLSAEWFVRWLSRAGGAGTVLAEVKGGRCDTEMNAFRFDVTLQPDAIGDPRASSADRDIQDGRCTPGQDHPDDLRAARAGTVLWPRPGRALRVLGQSAADGLTPRQASEFGLTSDRADRRLSTDPLGVAIGVELSTVVRTRLADHLSAGAVPRAVVVVDEIPRTPSGRPDAAALPVPQPQPHAHGREPVTRTEAELCRIWLEVLGLSTLGTTDNFFEIGGDSLVWLQVVSRAQRVGLALTWRDVFDHQSIVDMAAALDERARMAEAVKPGSGGAVSHAPLTGIQRWLIDNFAPEHRDWQHQSAWLELPPGVTQEQVRNALAAVARRHPILDARLDLGVGTASMRVGKPRRIPVEVATEEPHILRAAVAATRAAVGVSGPLQAACLVVADGDGAPTRLWWVVHHLVVDAHSWKILTSELIEHLESGPDTGSVTNEAETTYLAWASGSPDRSAETDYWRAVVGNPSLRIRRDRSGRSGRYRESRTLTRNIDVPGARPDHALAAVLLALGEALRPPEADEATIWVEGHGRNVQETDRPETSSAIGWFTALYPLLVPATISMARMAGRLARVPAGGHGYLDLLAEGQVAGCTSDVVVNVLPAGGAGALPEDLGRFAPARDESDPEAPMPHALEVTMVTSPTGASLELRADRTALGFAALRSLADRVAETTTALLRDSARWSPGIARTFDLLDDDVLASPALANLLTSPSTLEVLPLSEGQRLMVLRHLRGRSEDPNYNLGITRFDGAVDRRAMIAAWEALTARHSALRTSVEWLGLPRPLAVVHRTGAELEVFDWSTLPPERAAVRLRELEATAHRDRPPLSGRPPVRVTLVVLEDDCELIWRDHHVLLDGWATQTLLYELLAAYRDLRAGHAPFAGHAPVVGPARVARWRSRTTVGSDVWGEDASGFVVPTPLPGATTLALPPGSGEDFIVTDSPINPRLQRRLSALRGTLRTTLPTLVAAAWASILHRSSSEARVCFGISLHGRPPSLGEPTQMVGNYAVALPLVVAIKPEDTFGSLVVKINSRSWGLQQASGAVDLSDAYEATGMPLGRMMFASLLVTHGYDALNRTDDHAADGPRVREASGVMATGLPLTLNCSTDQLQVVLDRRMFAPGAEEWIADCLLSLLEAAAGAPETSLADLPIRSFERVDARDTIPTALGPAPQGPEEELVASIWRDVLGVSGTGRDASVFEVGATSLSLLALLARLSSEATRPIALTELFEHTTIASMAQLLDTGQDHSRTNLGMADRADRRRAALAARRPRLERPS